MEVQNRQVRLRLLVQGRGPEVLLLPSLGRGAEDFDHLAAKLAEAGFRAIRPQPRGISGSTGPLSGLTLDAIVGDAVAALDQAGARSAIVVGHAFGNRVARRLATLHPDRVGALILLAAGGRVRMSAEIEAALLRCFDLSLEDEARMASIRQAFFAPGNDASSWRSGWWPEAAAAQVEASQKSETALWWRGGGRPILVLQGLQDVLAPVENGRLLKQELLDQVELVEVDRAGHAMLPEQPDLIARMVAEFARRHAPLA